MEMILAFINAIKREIVTLYMPNGSCLKFSSALI